MEDNDKKECEICFGRFKAKGDCTSVLRAYYVRCGLIFLLALVSCFSPAVPATATAIKDVIQNERSPPIEETLVEIDIPIEIAKDK